MELILTLKLIFTTLLFKGSGILKYMDKKTNKNFQFYLKLLVINMLLKAKLIFCNTIAGSCHG